MQTKWLNAISKSPLFNNIPEDFLPEIISCLTARAVPYKKNEVVAMDGETFTGVGLILCGEVAVVKENYAGSRTILSILYKGDIFGEIAAFNGENKWPSTVLAQSDCTILYIHPEKILGYCQRSCSAHRMLLNNMLRVISFKAYMLNRKVEYLSVKSMQGKLAKYFLEHYRNTRSLTFSIPMNREELAEFLNVSRPSMSRELCKMRDEGVIDFYRESIRIINLERLQEMLE